MTTPNTATFLDRLLTFFRTAADTSFDPTESGLDATTVQAAIDLLAGGAGGVGAPFLPTSASSPIDVAEYPNPTDGYTVQASDIGRTLQVTGDVTLILPVIADVPVGAMFGAHFSNGGAVRTITTALNSVSGFDPANRPIYFEGAPSGWTGLIFGSEEFVVFRKVSSAGDGTWNVWRLMRPAPLAPTWNSDPNETGSFDLIYGYSSGTPYANKSITVTGNVTLTGSAFLAGPGRYLLSISNSGAFTWSWPNDWKVAGSSFPTVTPSGEDLYELIYDGSTVTLVTVAQDIGVPP